MSRKFAANIPSPLSFVASGNKQCFLCGSNDDLTREHIFPDWLQKRCQLQAKSFVLKNRTSIKFAQLLVPMCGTCNELIFGKLETKVSTASFRGYEGLKQIDDLTLFLWVSKIFIALRFKELTLKDNIKLPSSKPMLTPRELDFARAVLVFLHTARKTVLILDKPAPFSVLVVNLLGDDSEVPTIDYWDHDLYRTVGIRIGNVGLIAAFGDLGQSQSHYGDYLERAKDGKLDTNQFWELLARVAYSAKLCGNVTPRFLRHPEAPNIIIANSAYQVGSGVKWDAQEFIRLLRSMFDVPDLPPGLKRFLEEMQPWETLLFRGKSMKMANAQGELLLIPPSENPRYYLPPPEERMSKAFEQAKLMQMQFDSING